MNQTTSVARPQTAVAYIRTASYSLPNDSTVDYQRRICEARAQHLGVPITEVYIDTGVSGLAENRPGLDRLLADLLQGHIGYVIVVDTARLARSRVLAESLMGKLRGLNVKLITARKQ